MFITSKNKYLSNDMKIFGTCSIPLRQGGGGQDFDSCKTYNQNQRGGGGSHVKREAVHRIEPS